MILLMSSLPLLLSPQGTPAAPASLLFLRHMGFLITSGPLHVLLPLSRSPPPGLTACTSSRHCPCPRKGPPGPSPKGPEPHTHGLSHPLMCFAFLRASVALKASFVLNLSVSLACQSTQEDKVLSVLCPALSPVPTTASGTGLSKYLWGEREKINERGNKRKNRTREGGGPSSGS